MFKVKQVVRTYGLLARITAGPYSHPEEGVFYVLETPDGHHIIRDEDEMSPVEE